ncbi:MAG: type II toxin-antitoxin system HicB family antitoxin [bacterium]
MKYRIAIEQTEEGYSVHVPGLPGCWSQGDTEEEAIANIKDAIADYISAHDDLLSGADIREVDVPV